MVQNVQRALQAIYKCQEGTTAIIFALCLLPMLMVLGFAIDFSRIVSADNHLQAAVDDAVLASALDYSRNAALPESERLAEAVKTFNASYEYNIATANLDFSTVSIEISRSGENGIEANVTGNLLLAFGGLFGRESINLPVRGAAEADPARAVELVLVLDNTTSMFSNNRFNLMRAAAKDFVNNLMDASAGPDATAIGIVPWATLVNINSERPGGFDTSDASSRSPSAAGTRNVPNDPFEDRLRYLLEPEEEENYTRVALERDFAPVAWRGCIRSAPDERTVTSGGRVTRALSDAPVRNMRWHISLVRPELETVSAPASFDPDANNPTDAAFTLEAGRILRCTQRPQSGSGNIYNDADRACSNANNSANIRLAKACVSDPNEFDYFRQGGEVCPWQRNIFPWTSRLAISGPNQNCPVAMLGLSQDRGQLIDKLDEMYPVSGGTHMDVGLMWGLRILSPRREWADFFGQDRPKAFDDIGVRKVLVLLTDGQNVAPGSIEGYYGCVEGDTRGQAGECWQAPGVPDLRTALNGLTTDACTAIRETYNIEIFTIAVDITDNNAINLLADCAGNAANAFNIRASEIDAVFASIAARQLRLTN